MPPSARRSSTQPSADSMFSAVAGSERPKTAEVLLSKRMTLKRSRGVSRASYVRTAAFASRSDSPAIEPDVSMTSTISRAIRARRADALAAGGTSINS